MVKSYKYLIQWLFIACIAGVVGTIVIQLAFFLYYFITDRLWSIESIPMFVWPAAGALIAAFFIYRIEPRAQGEGTPSYILSINDEKGFIPLKQTVFSFFAAVLTLGTFGNGGFLGPFGLVSAGAMSGIQRRIPRWLITKEQSRLFPICGLAAAFGALLHSPLGAGIFAVEVTQKSSIRYRPLFPAILAASISVYISRRFGFEPMFKIYALRFEPDLHVVPALILLSVAAGIVGLSYTKLYRFVERVLKRDIVTPHYRLVVRTLLGSLIAFIPLWFINPFIVGISGGVLNAVLRGGKQILYGNLPDSIPLFMVLILLIILKSVASMLTIGSGMSAGFAGPSIVIGLLVGACFAEIFGIYPGTPEYFALLAAGFSGVLASTMNTPIAVAVLTVELFGLHYSLPAAMGAVIGFQVNRQHTLYDMVFEKISEGCEED